LYPHYERLKSPIFSLELVIRRRST
jgi:hypothetical protein